MTDGGHPNVWEYTPKQFFTYLHLAQRRKRLAMADMLSLHATAARGEPKAVDRILKQWGKDDW